jgi:O-antigen/teichoic acid export membrane protein
VSDKAAAADVAPSSSLRHTAVWTLADQAVSSLTNAGLAIIVARSVSDTAFGAFSIALLTFSFVIGASRAMISDPLVIRYSAADWPRLVDATRRAGGLALIAGIASALVCAIAGLLMGNPDARTALLALAIAWPGLLVQDLWRYAFYAAGRPQAAFLDDVIWSVLQFGLVGALLATGNGSILMITLAWGCSAMIAGIIGCLQMRALPAPSRGWGWFREHRQMSIEMGLSYGVNMGAVNLATYVVGAIAGLAGVGGLRAAQTLLGPLQLLFSGVSSFVLPMMSRRVAAGGHVRGPAMLTAGVAAAISLTWVTILMLIPTSAGVRLLGASWDGAREVLLATGVVSIAVSIAMGGSLGLKALSRSDFMLSVIMVQAPLIIGLGAIGAMMNGAAGAAVGFAIAQVVGAVLSWLMFLMADRPQSLRGMGRHRSGPQVPQGRPAARHAVRPGPARTATRAARQSRGDTGTMPDQPGGAPAPAPAHAPAMHGQGTPYANGHGLGYPIGNGAGYPSRDGGGYGTGVGYPQGNDAAYANGNGTGYANGHHDADVERRDGRRPAAADDAAYESYGQA